jgi:hypothetical protein
MSKGEARAADAEGGRGGFAREARTFAAFS